MCCTMCRSWYVVSCLCPGVFCHAYVLVCCVMCRLWCVVSCVGHGVLSSVGPGLLCHV